MPACRIQRNIGCSIRDRFENQGRSLSFIALTIDENPPGFRSDGLPVDQREPNGGFRRRRAERSWNDPRLQYGSAQNRVYQGRSRQEITQAALRRKDMGSIDALRKDGVDCFNFITIPDNRSFPVSNHDLDIGWLKVCPFKSVPHGNDKGPCRRA